MNSTNNNRGKQLRAYPVDFQDNLILGFFYGNIKKIGQNNSGDEIYSFIVPKEDKREKLMRDLKEALDKTPHLLELVTELLLMKKNNSNKNKNAKKNSMVNMVKKMNGNNGQGNIGEEIVEQINVQEGGAKKKKGYSCRKGGKAHTHKTAKAKKDCKKKKKTTKKKAAKKKKTKK